MISRTLLSLCIAASSAAFAEDAKARSAREELERQLSQMVGQQPTKVRIEYAGLDEPNYGIEEALFELDGRVVGSPSVRVLSEEGRHLVWNGDVPPGKHVVKVLLVFVNATSAVLSDEGGYKWRVGGSVGFDVHAGIEVRVTVIPKRDPSQVEVARRFKLALPAEPVMLARLDDGKMPEPVRPVAPAPVVDPGPLPPPLVAAVVEPKAQAPTASLAQAKLIAAEERPRAAAEAAETRRLGAEDMRGEREQAAGVRRRAAAGEPQGIAETGPSPARPDSNSLVTGSPDPLGDVAVPGPAPVPRAGPGEGTPVAGAPPSATEASQPPWLFIGLGVGVLLHAGLIALARRAARPPTLDD